MEKKKMRNSDLLSDALDTIAGELRTVLKSIEISDSLYMKDFVVDLYVAVFDVLCAAMDWYGRTSQRIKDALNKNSGSQIEAKVSSVQQVLARIRLEAEQTTQHRVKKLHQALPEISRGMQNIQRDQKLAGDFSRQNAKTQGEQFAQLSQKVDLLMVGLSGLGTIMANCQAENYRKQQVATRARYADRESVSAPRREMLQITASSPDAEDDPVALRNWYSEEMKDSIPCLNAFEDGRLDLLASINPLVQSLLPEEVIYMINDWIAEASSKFLWVEGPVSDTAAQDLSTVAVRIFEAALDSSNPVPCVFFTPKTRKSFKAKVESIQEQELMSLLYCVARQLINVLPEVFESPVQRLDENMLAKLDGTFASATATLDFIQFLLAESPPNLIVILDKLQLAESKSTLPHLERLIKLFREHAKSHLVKALFITGGRCRFLSNTVDFKTERVDAGRMLEDQPDEAQEGYASPVQYRANVFRTKDEYK